MITRQGYRIEKASLDAEKTIYLRKTLTVSPKVHGKQRVFGETDSSFQIYAESEKRFYVPRAWGIKEFGIPTKSILSEGNLLRPDLTFIGTPYDYQKDIVNTFIKAGSNGLICVPCGRGKTFMAIQIAFLLKRKFLIVVDKEFLLQQWSSELQSLIPGIRIGIIQENKKQIDVMDSAPEPTLSQLKILLKQHNLPVSGTKPILLERLRTVCPKEKPLTYDCSIAMIQTLVARDFDVHDFDSFGFTIFDECHHLGASCFSRALLKVQTRNILGLSATPTRDDGLTKVFEWFIGEAVYWEKIREADPDVIVRKIDFTSEEESYAKVPVNRFGEVVLAQLLGQIVKYEPRNKLIDELILELLKEPLRKTLILGDRIEHLERIEANLPEGTAFGYYIGGMDADKRENGARTAKILLGTYAMASEAMNIKSLNTMIMISPRKKIEQSTGRILRIQKDKRDVQPLIIDIVDSHSVYKGQWLKRRAYYKKCAYKIVYPSKGEAEPEVIKEDDSKKEEGICLMVND